MEETDFGIVAPSNVGANFEITQDNTGLVTITPTGDNVISFDVDFGDGSAGVTGIAVGKNVKHTYTEATHTVKVTAHGLNKLKTSADVQLVVSFKAPQNLVVTIVNDATISKKVNVTATADFATSFDFYSGESGSEKVSANIGATASFTYKDAGTYSVKVTAKGGAIATTDYTADFEVTAIMQPMASAPTPKDRPSSSVVSIYSGKYTDVTGSDFYPNWGQTTQYAEYDLNGDKMLQYSKLNYQGIQFGSEQDVSGMEFLHVDAWTADLAALEIFPISKATGEKSVTKDLTKDQWTSIDIPISAFTDQGLSMADIHQFKFVGSPWNGGGFGTVFLDNIYFYKKSELKLPIKFDKEEKFKGDGGASFELSKDPDNSSNNTGKVTNSGSDWENIQMTLDQPIKIVKDANNKYSVKIHSPDANAHTLMIKLEESGDNEYIELKQNFSTQGWNTITFDMSTITAQAWPNAGAAWDGTADFKKLVFFIDGGASTAGIYHIDDIMKIIPTSGAITAGTLISGFETAGALSGFDGGSAEVIANPDTSGNSSDHVLKLVKDAGQTWGGQKYTVTDKFKLDSESKLRVKVWSPRVGLNFMMKFEDSVGWPNTTASAEVTATTTKANEWEELIFDYSGISSSVEWYNLVMFIDNGTMGDGSSNFTIYVDDITQYSTTTSSTISDFETAGALSGFDGGSAEVIANPDTSGNSSDHVLKLVKDAGQTWGGQKYTVTDKFKLDSESKLRVKVWSPRVGLNFMMKFEDSVGWPNTTASAEVTATTTKANEWEELIFDYSGISSSVEWYNLVMFIDNGTMGDGSSNFTIYVDDITQF